MVECGQTHAGHVLERLDTMHEGGQEQVLDEPIVVLVESQPGCDVVAFRCSLPVHLQIDLMLLFQKRSQLVLVEILGVLEIDPHHVGERLVAVGNHIPEVA